MKLLSHVHLFAIPWTVAYQVSSSMEFSRQECWSGLPFPSPGDVPDPGIKPRSPVLQADALPSELPGKLYCIARELLNEVVPGTSVCPLSETGVLGDFWGHIKGAKYRFAFQDPLPLPQSP